MNNSMSTSNKKKVIDDHIIGAVTVETVQSITYDLYKGSQSVGKIVGNMVDQHLKDADGDTAVIRKVIVHLDEERI